RMSELEAIGGDVEDAIERVRVPAYVIDGHGIIRWLNPAARKLVGDVRGRQLTSVVVIGADGRRVAIEVSAVPLREGGHVIGVFGQVLEVEKDEPPPPPHPHLT